MDGLRVKLPDATHFNGYTWYFSTVYGNWQLISPRTGFYHFGNELDIIRFVRKESGHDASSALTERAITRDVAV